MQEMGTQSIRKGKVSEIGAGVSFEPFRITTIWHQCFQCGGCLILSALKFKHLALEQASMTP